MSVLVVDDLLPQGYADQIEYDLMSTPFPWYYIDDVTSKSYGSNSGFAHVAYDLGKQPTEWYAFLKPIVYHIERAHGKRMTELLRIRVGLLMPNGEVEYSHNTPHVDFTMPHYTACYYVTDSDGDTVVFDQHLSSTGLTNITEEALVNYAKDTQFTVDGQASPKKNRVCIFDGLQFHASTKPKNNSRRIVITVNYVS
jgi:hypothetical protein